MKKRKCKICQNEYPLDKHHYFMHPRAREGFQIRCKQCMGSKFTEEIPKGYLKCSGCKEIKKANTDNFHRGKDTKEGFKSKCKKCRNEENLDYHFRNREERIEYARKYREENKEKLSAYQKRYYEKVKNTEEFKIKQNKWNKNWYRRNKTEFLKWRKEDYRINRERYIKAVRKYQSTPKGYLSKRRNNHKRRMREQEVIATLTVEQWQLALEYFDHKCCYCGKGKELTQDHFHPLSRGGEYTHKNIIPSCKTCNFSKGDRDFFEWYPQQKDYSKTREKKILKYLGIKNNQQQIVLL